MEHIKRSLINETWKLCTLAGFLGLFLLTLLVATTNPPIFQISFSTTTFDVSSVEIASNSTGSISEVSKNGESLANQTIYADVKSTSSNSIDVKGSTIEVFKDVESLADQTDLTVDHNSTFNVLFKESNSNSSSATEEVLELDSNSTTGAKEYEIPTAEANYNTSSAATIATAGEYEIQANQTNFINTTSEVDALFQSVNSSGSFEEKLFSSTESTAANASAVEYELPTYETSSFNNSSTVEEQGKQEMISSGAGGEAPEKCKMYEGRWVYKPEENPRYAVYDCPFLEDKMSCRKNGRPDSDYEGWGWESHDCHVPLFNATDMLERLRGKRMLIAGDSLNRNMWESLACLLYSSIPHNRAYVSAADPAYKVLKAKDYEFTLEFYWAPFLVPLDEKHKSGRKVLSLDKVVPSSKKWRGADVMVFNSGHWWTHLGKLRAWDVFEYKGEFVEEMEKEVAYERALSTWAQWVGNNVDPTKTKVYYRSISPEHQKQWCFNHSRPMGDDEPYRLVFPRSMINVVERKIREANAREGVVDVRYLNITGLSSSRIDAHPSIYRFKHWKVITEKYKRFLKSRSDCSHWCLPGLPDTWNRILYASLFFDHLSTGDVSNS